MHVIQSSSIDASTNDVIDWMLFLSGKEEKILRFNNETGINSLTYRINNSTEEHIAITTDKGDIYSDDIKSFWYRRGNFRFISQASRCCEETIFLKELTAALHNNLSREQDYINDILYHTLHKLGRINTFQENFTNKITNLSLAAKAGLAIPDTLITNNFEELVQFSNIHEQIITKDIEFNSIVIPCNEHYNININTTVQLLSKSDVLNLRGKYTSNTIAKYAFYQQYIEKDYELRLFYFKEKIYPMAIFSQGNEKTKVDFRNYDQERPNRCVPYSLPDTIAQNIIVFMRSIDMNSGSIDMIVTPQGVYSFLEVNPLGQFQWLSKNCNYDIERQIALHLLNTENNE